MSVFNWDDMLREDGLLGGRSSGNRGSGGLNITFDFSDVERAIKALNRIGKSPQRATTKAASKGMTVVRRRVRQLVPVGETGNLRRGLRRKGEKARVKGKKVYDLGFDPGMNDVLQKPVMNPGAAGSTSTKNGHAYYPASMEYGFLTRSKGGGLSYVPGYEFMKKGTEEASSEARQVMIDTAMKELAKEWTQD